MDFDKNSTKRSTRKKQNNTFTVYVFMTLLFHLTLSSSWIFHYFWYFWWWHIWMSQINYKDSTIYIMWHINVKVIGYSFQPFYDLHFKKIFFPRYEKKNPRVSKFCRISNSIRFSSKVCEFLLKILIRVKSAWISGQKRVNFWKNPYLRQKRVNFWKKSQDL